MHAGFLCQDMDENMCGVDPWLVLHKIDSPTKMRFIGNRVATCSFEESDKVAPSLAPYVKRELLISNSPPPFQRQLGMGASASHEGLQPHQHVSSSHSGICLGL